MIRQQWKTYNLPKVQPKISPNYQIKLLHKTKMEFAQFLTRTYKLKLSLSLKSQLKVYDHLKKTELEFQTYEAMHKMKLTLLSTIFVVLIFQLVNLYKINSKA